MNPTSTPIRKATSASALLLVLLLVLSIIIGAPWWAIWAPLMVAFVVSAFILLCFAGASMPQSAQRSDNVVDMRPRT